MNAAILDEIRQKRGVSPLPPAPRVITYACPLCKDMKWVIDPSRPIDPGRSGSAIPCVCNRQARSREHALTFNSQRPSEMTIRLFDIQRGPHNEQAIIAVQDLIDARCGLLTLTGLPGRGKSTLLHALTNEMRLLGAQAEYAQAVELFDYLREGFDQPGEFDRRWRKVLDLPALVVDEMDHFNATDWATERLVTLVEQRWRDIEHKVTAFALNTQVGQILQQTGLAQRVIRRLTAAQAIVVTLYDPKTTTHPSIRARGLRVEAATWPVAACVVSETPLL